MLPSIIYLYFRENEQSIIFCTQLEQNFYEEISFISSALFYPYDSILYVKL